jgi:hypothetical protein
MNRILEEWTRKTSVGTGSALCWPSRQVRGQAARPSASWPSLAECVACGVSAPSSGNRVQSTQGAPDSSGAPFLEALTMSVGLLGLSTFNVRRTDTNSLLRMIDQLIPLLSGSNLHNRSRAERTVRRIDQELQVRKSCSRPGSRFDRIDGVDR